MQFNTLLFLFLFLPAALLLTLASGKRLRNLVLLIFSLVFYAWAGASYTVILVSSIIINYTAGLIIQKYRGRAKILLIVSICINVGLLITFRYLSFLLDNFNIIITFFGSAPIVIKKIVMPLGISFFTFCNLSYLIDIARGETNAEKNIIRYALYLSFFPRVISGPIVRYKEAQEQLRGRKITLENFTKGIERFIIGLGKKALIADTFAIIANHVFSMQAADLSFYTSWIGIITFTLQLYFDFSGYSDMAIGLGRMFGFTIAENFNYPYISKSIQEFWQRWHITLSSWLRDYLFTPLLLKYRNSGNIGIAFSVIITFFICGLWHGPSWTYIIWGLIHGVFLTIENTGFRKQLKKLWKPLGHLYVLIIVIFAWVFFRSPDLKFAFKYCSAMLGFSSSHANINDLKEYFDNAFYVCLIIALAGSAGVFEYTGNTIKSYFSKLSLGIKGTAEITYSIIEMVVLLVVFVVSIGSIASNNYNPFIYFRF